MLCAVGWLGGEMICGAGVLRPSALVTRSAKSLVVDIITFLSRCMMASRFVYGAVFPAVSPGRCVRWCLCAVGWVRGEMVHRAVDFRHSALDTRSAKSLVVLSSTVVMPSGVCCYVLLVLYVASLWVCGGMSVFGWAPRVADDLGSSALDTRSAKGLTMAISICALSYVMCWARVVELTAAVLTASATAQSTEVSKHLAQASNSRVSVQHFPRLDVRCQHTS